MNHIGTQKLETNRLILRKFCLADAPAKFRNWANDQDVIKYLSWQPHANATATEEVLKGWIESYQKPDFYNWAIVLKSIDEPIGVINALHVRDNIKMVHMGYCIGKAWWGQGMAAEAFEEVIDFFFNKVGVNRIEARHDPSNQASAKVILKCGLIYEGTSRQADTSNQGICDAANYAILADDFFIK